MGAVEANVAVGAAVLLAGLSLLLAVVGLIAYRRVRHGRLLWIAVAFAGFFAQGVLLTIQAFEERGETGWPTMTLLNLAIVGALYVAVLRR